MSARWDCRPVHARLLELAGPLGLGLPGSIARTLGALEFDGAPSLPMFLVTHVSL